MGVFDSELFILELEKISGGRDENLDITEVRGQSSVLSLSIGTNGVPNPDSLLLNMAVWSLAAMSHGDQEKGIRKDALAFQKKAEDFLREELEWRIGNHPEDAPFDSAWLHDFANFAIQKLRTDYLFPVPAAIRVKAERIIPNRSKANTPVQSTFYAADLEKILLEGGPVLGPALSRFLSAPTPQERTDVRRSERSAIASLLPSKYPQGAWPSEFPLVWGQQVAINNIWDQLRHEEGLSSVNGPPGTGKTTLLRDLVAAVVVERAKILAKPNFTPFLSRQYVDKEGKQVPYYPLARELDGFSIVVASTNNGPVENITLELPASKEIAEKWRPKVDCFGDVGSALLGNKEAWACVSGRLGKREHRDAFKSAFWWGATQGQPDCLRTKLVSLAKSSTLSDRPWNHALNSFRAALAEESEWRV